MRVKRVTSPLASPPGVGPLIPADQAAVTRFMGLRYGAFLHWGPATVSGKEISWSRNQGVPPEEYDALYKRFNPVLLRDVDELVQRAAHPYPAPPAHTGSAAN